MKLDAIAAEWVSQDEKLLGQARKGRLTAFMDHLTPELVERWRAEAEALPEGDPKRAELLELTEIVAEHIALHAELADLLIETDMVYGPH